jgi:hypothetical protein
MRETAVAGLVKRDQLECFAVDRAFEIVDQRLARQHGLSQMRIGVEQRAHCSRNLVDHQPAHADGMQAQLGQGAIERLRRVSFHRIRKHDCSLARGGLSHSGQ